MTQITEVAPDLYRISMNAVLRPGRVEDAEACGAICFNAFKAIAKAHHFPPDFPSSEAAIGLLASLLTRNDIYSVVAERDGRIVGSNFLWEDGIIAGVGPITIDLNVQNGALGRQLMEDVLGDFQERIYHVSVVAWMERSEMRGLEASQSWIPFHFIQATGRIFPRNRLRSRPAASVCRRPVGPGRLP